MQLNGIHSGKNRIIISSAIYVLVLLFCFAATAAPTNPVIKESDRFDTIPEILRFTQEESGRININDHFFARHLLPHTVSESLNDELGSRLLKMEEKAIEILTPLSGAKSETELDTGAMIFRTGRKIMSFELISSGMVGSNQVYVDMDAFVYDMETGMRIMADDLFEPDSMGWNIVENKVKEQLTGYFPDMEADPEKLDMLSSREHLTEVPFLMTAGRLIFCFRADELYADRQTLMYAEIYYPEINEYLNEEIRSQTDNTCYRLAAITFDDGPAASSSNLLINKLMKYGVAATFFNVGTGADRNRGAVCREHDLCFDVGSHNYIHDTRIGVQDAANGMKQMDELYSELFGLRPVLFRAPGGNFKNFIAAGNDLPMIKWSVIGGDAEDKSDGEIILMLSGRPNAGDIVLMHDLANRSSMFVEEAMPTLEQRNVMCVTVRELCSIYGLELNSEDIVISCEEQVLKIINAE